MIDPLEQLYNLLKGVLNVEVVTEVPKSRPAQFISVELVGVSDYAPGIVNASFALQTWALSHAEAAKMGHELRRVLKTFDQQGAGRFVKLKLNQMVYWPDPDSQIPRYQLVIDSTLYDQ